LSSRPGNQRFRVSVLLGSSFALRQNWVQFFDKKYFFQDCCSLVVFLVSSRQLLRIAAELLLEYQTTLQLDLGPSKRPE